MNYLYYYNYYIWFFILCALCCYYLYYAHYITIIRLCRKCLICTFMRSPRVAASSCWRRMLVDMSARPRPNIYIHIYNHGHGSQVLVTAVVLRQQALEPLRERGGERGREGEGGEVRVREGGRGGGENGRERWDQDDHITHHRQQLPFPFMCFRWTWWNKGTCIMRIIRIMRIIGITALLLPLQMRGLVE